MGHWHVHRALQVLENMVYHHTHHLHCCHSVFKHKYLTNPSSSPADALITAAANLAHVIQHNAKAQHIGAKNLQDLKRLQQLFGNTAKPQLNIMAPSEQTSYRALPPRVPTLMPLLPLPIVSDDEDSDDELVPPPRVPPHCAIPLVPQPTTTPPTLNMRSHIHSLMYKTMLHTLSTHHNDITTSQATQQHGPTNRINAVLNEETGELMEYQHLVSNPKYCDTWKNAYGKEL